MLCEGSAHPASPITRAGTPATVLQDGTSLRALSPYGPVKAGLTTLPDQETVRANQLQQLSELLSSLESVVDRLNFKSFEAYATLATALEGVRVALYDSTINTGGTDTL